jgi:hypothetical protein
MRNHVITLALGAAFIIIGTRMLFVARRQRRGAVRATGTVVRLDKSGPVGGPGVAASTGYTPVIQFETADGRQAQFEPRLWLNATVLALFARRYLPGHRLTVYYQPGDPQQANVNGAVLSWVIPVACVIAGVALMTLSA